MPRRQDFAEVVLLGAPRFFHFLLIFERFYGIMFLDLGRVIAPFLLPAISPTKFYNFVGPGVRAFLFNKRINYEQNTNKCIKFVAK